MRIRAIVLVTVLGAAQLGAQVVHTKPAASAGAVAGIAPTPAVVVVPGTSQVIPQPGTVVYANLPVVVLPDGRVFADFGRGYEQIARSCGAPMNVTVAPTVSVQPSTAGQPTVTQPVVTQPGVLPPLPYTPAVPNQQTPSQQMLNQPTQVSQSVIVNSRACWSSNGRGQVFVTRP